MGISNLTFTENLPEAQTTINYLVLVLMRRNTWKAWNGSAWVTVALSNIDTLGNNSNILSGLTASNWALLFVAGTFDMVASLKTTDSSQTPQLGRIIVNTIVAGNQEISILNFQIVEVSPTVTTVCNATTSPMVGLIANIAMNKS